jgi:uncharacterized protein YodC (DUF2158 family)
MVEFWEFIKSIIAGVASAYICKWLDGLNKKS